MVLSILAIVLLLFALLVALYYWLLALTALFAPQNKLEGDTPGSEIRFAIVIPAHNEENGILPTIRSCDALLYPNDKYTVFVVADNCTDRTADVVRQAGAVCLERFDKDDRGKGHALAWGFAKIGLEAFDGVVVLDADCCIDPHGLEVFSQYLRVGEKVLQANDVASNPDDSPLSYAMAVGNYIENELFYAPKSQLHWTVFLRGTGMVFRSEILQKYPWRAHSVVEDIEYTLHLLRQNIQVRFVKEVKVASEYPANQQQLRVQRSRWAEGNLGFGRQYALALIWEGIRQGKWPLIDAGWTFIVLSRPLVLLQLFFACMAAAANYWLHPYLGFSKGILFFSAGILFLQVLYFLNGIMLLGINGKRVGYLLSVPIILIKLIAVTVSGLFGGSFGEWNRTPRE